MGDYSEVLQQMKKVIEDTVVNSTATSESILATIARRTIMTSEYTPQVGDRVRQPDWKDSNAVTVNAVGKNYFLASAAYPNGVETEGAFAIQRPWVKVAPPPTYPERWINVYPWLPVGRGLVESYFSKDLADENAGSRRIAVIHLASDGTVTLHPTKGHAS